MGKRVSRETGWERLPDALARSFHLETMARKAVPAWLGDALARARDKAGGKFPGVVLAEPHPGGSELGETPRMVLMEWETFLEVATRTNKNGGAG